MTYPADFKFYYVSPQGDIAQNDKPDNGTWLSIVGTPGAHEESMYVVSTFVLF